MTATSLAAAGFVAVPVAWSAGRGFAAPLPRELDSPATLVLAFADASLGRDDGPVRELAAAFPGSVVLACSSAGEIRGDFVEEGTLSGVVMRFARSTLRWTMATVEGRGDRDTGRQIAAALADDDLRGVFVLSDGLAVNGSDLARGLDDVLPPSVAVAGGLAGDGDRFGATWVAAGPHIGGGHIAAVGVYGPHVEFGVGSAGGWGPFGPGRRVTRSDGNVLHEIDGAPALPLYREYLGDYASQLPGSALLFPLSVDGENADGAVVRTILSIDEQAGSMTFAGDVREGGVARLMTSTSEQLAEAASRAAATAMRAISDDAGQVAAIAVSCVGRRLAMGQRVDDELVAALERLPTNAVQAGFYSYGEIGPGDEGTCVLHNQTMTMVTVTERGVG